MKIGLLAEIRENLVCIEWFWPTITHTHGINAEESTSWTTIRINFFSVDQIVAASTFLLQNCGNMFKWTNKRWIFSETVTYVARRIGNSGSPSDLHHSLKSRICDFKLNENEYFHMISGFGCQLSSGLQRFLIEQRSFVGHLLGVDGQTRYTHTQHHKTTKKREKNSWR